MWSDLPTYPTQLHYNQFLCISMVITEIILCWWMVLICQYVSFLSASPNHSYQNTPLSLCHPTSISPSVQNPYYLIWSNSLPVPQQFVLVCKLSNNMEDEKLSMYSLCPHFKFLQ